MGWLTGVGKLFGLISANPTASELAKDISGGVDMMFYTKEEKAIDSLEELKLKGELTVKAGDTWLRMVELMKDSEKYRSVTRRIIAVGIILNLMFMIWLGIFCEASAMFGWFSIDTAPIDISMGGDASIQLTSLSWSILRFASVFQLGWVFCTIIVFYFGPQLVQFFKK